MSNILDFLPAKSMKTKGPHEFAGPCPSCGGNDRFIVWPEREKGGAFLCRGCAAQGDGIAFLMQFHGMSYREACEALRLPPSTTGQSAATYHHARSVPKLSPPPAATMPNVKWQQQAAAFLHVCQADLETSPAAVLALAIRGLTPSTAAACGLGWNACDRYEHRTAWGLPLMQGKDKMVLPAGLVIATRRRSGPVALTIRTASPDRPKYWEVAGSGKNLPYVIGKTGLPVALLESALDAVLLWQEAGDLCAAVSFMGKMKGMDADTASFIHRAPIAIACPDNDDGGKTAWQRWSAAYPSAVCCPAAGAKDLTEMHIAALTDTPALLVRQWAESALTIALQTAPQCRESADFRNFVPTNENAHNTAQEAA